jgi:hypothetical protein
LRSPNATRSTVICACRAAALPFRAARSCWFTMPSYHLPAEREPVVGGRRTERAFRASRLPRTRDPDDAPGSNLHASLETSACVLACVGAGGRADETSEVAVQLALIVEADSGRDVGRLHACREELFRAHDTQPRRARRSTSEARASRNRAASSGRSDARFSQPMGPRRFLSQSALMCL